MEISDREECSSLLYQGIYYSAKNNLLFWRQDVLVLMFNEGNFKFQ